MPKDKGIPMSDRQIEQSTPYVDRLTKLIPAEFVAAYLAIHTLVTNQPNMPEDTQFYALLITGLILLVAQPVFLVKSLGVTSLSQNVVSAASLVIWIVSLGGVLDNYDWYLPAYSAISIILWTLLSPLLVRK